MPLKQSLPVLFIESIRLERGVPQNLLLHTERMQRTGRAQGFSTVEIPPLAQMCPSYLRTGTVKCRLIYRESIESITFENYNPRFIQSLALARLPNGFRYQHKYLRRELLDTLRLNSGADEVLLVDSEGYVTDSSYSNLLFQREEGVWETPAHPLLEGTMRAGLLAASSSENTPPEACGTEKENATNNNTFGHVVCCDIKVEDLASYTHLALINAMMPPEKAIVLPLSAIRAP